MKWFCDVAKRESFSSCFLAMFRLGLWLKIRFIAISKIFWTGILVKRLATSWETRNFLESFVFLIWKVKEKVTLHEKSLGTKCERRPKESG